jgi:hypothetical protein
MLLLSTVALVLAYEMMRKSSTNWVAPFHATMRLAIFQCKQQAKV